MMPDRTQSISRNELCRILNFEALEPFLRIARQMSQHWQSLREKLLM